jgi:hypothetical protein
VPDDAASMTSRRAEVGSAGCANRHRSPRRQTLRRKSRQTVLLSDKPEPEEVLFVVVVGDAVIIESKSDGCLVTSSSIAA